MKFSLRMFEKEIQKDKVVFHHYNSKMKLCRGLRIWSGAGEIIDNDQVYVLGSAAFLKAIREKSKLPTQMICISTDNNHEKIEKRFRKMSDDVSLLLIQDENGEKIWFNALSKSMDLYARKEECIREAIYQNLPLEEILNIFEEILDNPVGLFSSSLRVLAYSKNLTADNSPNRFWREATTHQFVSDELIVLLKDNKIYNDLRDSRNPILIDLHDGSKPYMTCNLFYENDDLGSISLFPVLQDICPSDEDILLQLVKIIIPRIKQEEYDYVNKYTRNQKLIVDLLKGKWYGKETVNRAMQNYPYDVSEGAIILILQDFKYGETDGLRPFIQNTLESEIGKCLQITMEDGIALICKCTQDENNLKDIILAATPKKYVRIGCSMKFNSWGDLYQQYEFAREAISWGHRINPEWSIYLYEDYAMYQRIDLIAKQVEIRNLCLSQIWNLYQYDLKTGNELVKSFYYYLIYGKSLEQASKKMNVHRTTLGYRLNKVKDMVLYDIDNCNVRQLVIQSCEIVLYIRFIKNANNKDI